ncbi:MAG: DUF4382 domain-containing protein [Nitrospirota bacterium]
MKKILWLLLIVSSVLLIPIILMSCGDGGGSSSNGSDSSGSVALYVTDSPDEDYKQVELTINSAQLLHTGSGTTCDVLKSPETIDLTDIASVLKLLDVTSCSARSYNRIHIELKDQGNLIDLKDVADTCTLTSYKDEKDNPNVLYCIDNACSMDINGAVNVLANKGSGLALDFELKDFELKDFEVRNFNSVSDCTVTMKVSPLNASDVDNYDEGTSGTISSLNTDDDTFILTATSGSFTVFYDGITNQQRIDDLLTFAQSNALEVEVKSTSIDLAAFTIDATVIHVEIEGTISNLDDTVTHTFTLTYQTSKTITVDYTGAEEVEGVLVNNVVAEVELQGYDGINYLAREIEVE